MVEYVNKLMSLRSYQILTFFLFFVLMPLIGVGQDIQNIELANQYYDDGEIDKALTLYEKLAKSQNNIQLIHSNYYQLLLNTGRYDDAEKYINKLLKQSPNNLQYKIDKGLIYERNNDENRRDKYFNDFIEEISMDEYKVRVAAQYMTRNNLYETTILLFLTSRKKLNDPNIYAIQLASIYRIQNQKDKMVDEYLNFVDENPSNLNYVKNALQAIMEDPEDLESFETLLLERIQKNPNISYYPELLIWVNLQQKDFYSAFIQARAVDKRQRLGGRNLLEIGEIALENSEYDNAIKIFNYIVTEYKNTPNYQIAKRFLIQSREEKVKNTYPVSIEDIKQLIDDYSQLIAEVGLNLYTVEALRNKALLHAFYLNEHQKAIDILKEIIEFPRMSSKIVDQCKLDLGDIYLLIGEPWESTLLYSQVEKSSKESPLGYEAKLKNAKLSYYRGDFSLAQDHLNILKEATTREIANDAMQLSLLIKDNTALDTSDFVMKTYAYIDLLLFQNKKYKALDSLYYMEKEFSSHPIIDEVLWLQAKILLELGEFQKAVEKLNIINEKYSNELLGDDALYKLGVIYEEYLKENDLAMKCYESLLKKFPGSIYTADARKRFRRLRGDFVN